MSRSRGTAHGVSWMETTRPIPPMTLKTLFCRIKVYVCVCKRERERERERNRDNSTHTSDDTEDAFLQDQGVCV